MKNSILLFLFLIPAFLFAQYPTTGNKSRLGWQTTGDGLIWRGVAGDTVNKPNNRNYPYFQLDTVNAVLYRYIATQGNWQAVGGGSIDIDSLVYATRFWVNSNFFPLQGGLLTGTGGSGFVGFPIQSSTPATPATGFSLYAGSTGNNISWMQPDGFFRRLVSPVTGVARQYQFMARSYTLGDSADIVNNVTSIAANYIATSNGTNLVAMNLFDNNTYVGILNSKPFAIGQWTTAGRPTGVTGYEGYNTTGNGKEWYNGTRWAYALESTFPRGGATRVPVFDANGQVTDNSGLTFVASTGLIVTTPISFSSSSPMVRIGMNSNTPTVMLETASGERASIDNLSGVVRFVRNAVSVPFQFNMSNGNLTSTGNAIFQGSGTTIFNQSGGSFGIGTATPSGLQVNTETTDPYRGTTNVRLGRTSTFPRIYLEEGSASNSQWNLDVVSGTLRFVRNSSTIALQINSSGQLGFGVTTPAYSLDGGSSTNAIRIPKGTTAQTPTGASGLFRFNTDSTFYQGYDGSSIIYFATRAYARSLVSALPTTNIYTANGTLSGNRTITGGNYNVDWDNISGFNLISGGATGATSITSDVYSSMKQYVNLAKTKYVQKYNTFDSRALTVSAFPNFVDIFEWNTLGSAQYEWGNATILDTTNSVFFYKHGGRYFPSFHTLGGSRPASGSAYRLTPVFDFNQSVIGNGSNWSPMATFRMGSDTAMQVKQDGTIEFSEYGTGTKEAADLSKTQSNYIAGFATDGTVTNYRIQRDTSTSDADFTVPADLLSTCQELFVSAEVTSGYTDTVCVILPLPSSTYANKKVHIFADDDNSTWWVAAKTLLGNGLYLGNPSGTKPAATNYVAVSTTTGFSGFTYTFTCTRRNSGTWHWVLMLQN